jgi:hypothetical protein
MTEEEIKVRDNYLITFIVIDKNFDFDVKDSTGFGLSPFIQYAKDGRKGVNGS